MRSTIAERRRVREKKRSVLAFLLLSFELARIRPVNPFKPFPGETLALYSVTA
jgi:hypothetical protein